MQLGKTDVQKPRRFFARDVSAQEAACKSPPLITPGSKTTGSTTGAGDKFMASCAGRDETQASADRVYRFELKERKRIQLLLSTPNHDGVLIYPSLVGGTTEDARVYLSRRYGTEFSTHAIERYCVVGSAATCAERAAEYVAAGAQHVVFHPAVEPAGLYEQIELLAEVAYAAAR